MKHLGRLVCGLVVAVACVTVGVHAQGQGPKVKTKVKCEMKTVAGAYALVRPDLASGSGYGVTDQLALTSDGVAYWYQSTAFDWFVSPGSFIPMIGSWGCLPDGNRVITTIGVNYVSTGLDLEKYHQTRYTQEMSVMDDDSLQTVHRVLKHFAMTDDPLDPAGGIVTSDSYAVYEFLRIRTVLSDIR
jgi:hypothetical protein